MKGSNMKVVNYNKNQIKNTHHVWDDYHHTY